MGFGDLGPVLGGLLKSSQDQREINRDDAQRQQAREDSVFHALANSDDPEVRAAAVTGLLHNDHPGTFFDKFFQKHRANPAFENIKNLVANGHQANPGETEQKRRASEANTAGGYSGRITGIQSGFASARAHGATLTPEDERRATLGALGAAERSPSNSLQAGAFYKDGKFVRNGFWDAQNRTFFNEDNTSNDEEGLQFIPAGKGAGSGGAAKTGAPPDPNKIVWDKGIEADTGQYGTRSPGGWIVGHNPITGEKIHKPAFQSQSFSPFQSNEGAVPFNNRSGTFGTPRPDLAAATPPATNVATIRGNMSQIARDIKIPTEGITGGPPLQSAVDAAIARRDVEAKKYGFPTFAAMQAAAGVGSAGVAAGVAPAVSGSPTGPPPVPPGGGAGARGKTAAPAKGASAPPAAGGSAAGAGGPVNDPLNILQHLR